MKALLIIFSFIFLVPALQQNEKAPVSSLLPVEAVIVHFENSEEILVQYDDIICAHYDCNSEQSLEGKSVQIKKPEVIFMHGSPRHV